MRCRSGAAPMRIRRRDPDGIAVRAGRTRPVRRALRRRGGRRTATRVHVDRIAELVDGRSDESAGAAARAADRACPGRAGSTRRRSARDRLAALAEAVDRRQRLGALAAIDGAGRRAARTGAAAGTWR